MRNGKRLSALLVTLAMLATAGCTSPVFHDPFTLSTASGVLPASIERLGPVAVEECAYLIALLPIPNDPRDGFDALLEEATKRGGNAVIDVQVRSVDSFGILFIFTPLCTEYSGVAAKI